MKSRLKYLNISNFFNKYNRNSVWLPDRNSSTLKKIASSGKILTIAGQAGKIGFRNGDLKNTLFNNCFSLAYYKPSVFQQLKENNSLTIILTNNSLPCLYVNRTNYTLCQNNSTNNTLINNTLIKKIYLKTDEEITNLSLISNSSSLINSVLFVADKDNHCIRLIDLQKRTSQTYAGVCEQSGFKDGLLGNNLFSSPESLGVDVFGNVFVYDSGNKYIRMIKTNGCVLTLVSGACRRNFNYDSKKIPGFDLKNDFVTCYREWMFTEGGDAICYSESQSNFCFEEIFLCKNEPSPFIYKNKTTPDT